MSLTYPLPDLQAARARLRHLEKLIKGVDARLKIAQPSGIPGLETERGRLTREYDALYAAAELLGEQLRHLPRCPCGKVSHVDVRLADQHAEALKLIDNQGKRPVNVYRCEAGGGVVFHVGHFGPR